MCTFFNGNILLHTECRSWQKPNKQEQQATINNHKLKGISILGTMANIVKYWVTAQWDIQYTAIFFKSQTDGAAISHAAFYTR